MKKLLKVIGVAVVVAVVVLAVSSTALHILLPPEKAKAMVLKQLTGHLKREVQLGDVSVGVLSGLSISDLRISEAPDFAHGTFLSSDHFSIRLALLPLLFRRVEVKEVALDHPVIRVVRMADGKTFNFSDLLTPAVKTAASPPSPLPVGEGGPPTAVGEAFLSFPVAYAATTPPANSHDSEPPFALVVSHAEIQNGVLHFLDQSPARQSVDIDPLNLKLKNVSLTSPFSVQAMLKAKARNVIATLKLAGDADLATDSFKIKSCELSSGGSTLTLNGKANHLKSNRPSVDLTLELKEFKLSTLEPFMPLPAALKLEGPIRGTARIKGDEKKMDFALQFNLDNVSVQYAKQFSKPAHVPMALNVQGGLSELQDLDVADLKAVLGSLQMTGHGKVLALNSSQPQLNLHLETNAFPAGEVAEYMAFSLPKGLQVKGKAQVAADVSGTQASSHLAVKCEGKDLDLAMGDSFKKPSGTPLRVSLVGESVRAVGHAAAKKSTKPAEQVFNIQSLGAALGPVEVNGSGSVHTSVTPIHFQLALKSNTFPLQELSKLVPMLAAYQLSGKAVADVRTSGTTEAPVANGSLSLQDASLRYQQSELTHVATALNFTMQDVSIPKLTGKLNGSDIALKLTGHKLTTQPDLNVEANIAELDLAKLLPASVTPAQAGAQYDSLDSGFRRNDVFALLPVAYAAAPPAMLPPAKLAGHLTVGHIKHEFYDAKNLDFKWNLTDVTPDLSRVNGTSTLKQGPGVLKNLEKLAAMSKSAKIALLPISTIQKMDQNGFLKKLGLPSLQTVTFTGIQGDYLLRMGVMDIKTFALTGQELNINTTGTIGLAGTQPLDLKVIMKLAAGSMGGTLGQIVQDESGRPTLTFARATGTASNPDIKWDTREVGQKAVQQLGQELFKNLGIGKNQQAAPPADNSGNGQPSQPAPSQQAAPSSQPNPADEIQKALKNIFH